MPKPNWNPTENVVSQSTDENIRVKVLRSATEFVESDGLTLGLRTGLIDEFAAGAGISKRQFSQVWSSQETFLADLFCELANQAQIDRADTETLLTTWQYLSSRVDEFYTSEGRRKVLVDVIRIAVKYNFDVVTASNKWRTYAALSTTILSWPEGEDRARMLDALRASELSFVDTMESFYRNLLPTVGYQLKAEFHNDYQPFVVAAASVIEGLGIVRATVPALVEAHFDLESESGTEAWSVASLAFIGVLDAFFEPNPDFDAKDAISRLSGGVDVTPLAQSDLDAAF